MLLPTVDKILKKFATTIDALESVSEVQKGKVKAYTQKMWELEEQRAASEIESVRAQAVANKLRALIEPDPRDYEFGSDEELLSVEPTEEV